MSLLGFYRLWAQMLYLLNQWMLTCYTQPPFDPLYVYFYDWKNKYTRYNLGCESNEGSKVGWCTLEWTGKHLIWILKSFQHLTEVKITRVMECSLYKQFEANEYWTGEIEGILKQMNGGVEYMYAIFVDLNCDTQEIWEQNLVRLFKRHLSSKSGLAPTEIMKFRNPAIQNPSAKTAPAHMVFILRKKLKCLLQSYWEIMRSTAITWTNFATPKN